VIFEGERRKTATYLETIIEKDRNVLIVSKPNAIKNIWFPLFKERGVSIVSGTYAAKMRAAKETERITMIPYDDLGFFQWRLNHVGWYDDVIVDYCNKIKNTGNDDFRRLHTVKSSRVICMDRQIETETFYALSKITDAGWYGSLSRADFLKMSEREMRSPVVFNQIEKPIARRRS